MMKIGLGGGCHWCTEAVFESLIGVEKVEQGFIAPKCNASFSEAVIVRFDEKRIGLSDLIEIHLHTHKSTSEHSMRNKYRSAIYVFDDVVKNASEDIIKALQQDFKNELITKVLYFQDFRASDIRFQAYYYSKPDRPFCETYISPKLKLLLHQFSGLVNQKKLNSAHELI